MTDEPWLAGVEGDELSQLIQSDEPIIRVVAGPGSGKTLGLKRRVRRLVEGDSVDPRAIFVGTFTRAIARELATELGTTVVYEEEEERSGTARDPEVSTLHSLALRLLRAHPEASPRRAFRFLLDFETRVMLYDVGRECPDVGDQTARAKMKNRITSGWAEGTSLGEERFRGAMIRWLERHGAMLIEEVVYLAREALRTGGIERGQFDHVIIDEYQDLTRAEQDLVEYLWSERGSLVILGDDNQSIYRFRDNHPQGVAEFASRHPDLLDVDLRANYRCSPEIVDLANTMMAQAGSPVVMASKRVVTAPVIQVYWPSVEDEVAGLAEFMKADREQSYLVLTPRRFMGYRLKHAIGDDAATSFYEESLETHLARERFTLGSLLANEDDAVAARCWLSFKGLAPEQQETRNAAAYASLGRVANAAVIRGIATGTFAVSGAGSTNIRRRAEAYVRLVEQAPADAHERLRFIFNPNLAAALPVEKRAKAKDDLTALRDSALGILDRLEGDDLAKVFNTLRYRIATRTPLRGDEEPRVRIMTLHGAKGLEADAVVLMGAADQVLPGPPVNDPQEQEARVEEQRRLLYVAVTRARDMLIVSWPRSVRFADGRGEAIRNDGIFTRDGEQYYRLSRAALIPYLDAVAVPGERWLRQLVQQP